MTGEPQRQLAAPAASAQVSAAEPASSPQTAPKRVLTVGPLPPEKAAYALARYSRSPDSIVESLQWVREHDSQKFLETYYFQYGHASIADLGHLILCFEGISELAAIEIEDEPLWDGQARSTRYQDFTGFGYVVPEELSEEQRRLYRETAEALLASYRDIHEQMVEFLKDRLPRPQDMPERAYERNIRARAFDQARYLLFLGMTTGVGQVTSIRTLEKQIRRLKASPYAELRSLADEMAEACARPADIVWLDQYPNEPVAPTLARYVGVDTYLRQTTEELGAWVQANLKPWGRQPAEPVDLMKPEDSMADIVASLLYPVCDWPYRSLYEVVRSWPLRKQREILDLAVRNRSKHDELLRAFRNAPYVFDIVIDIGAYRDLHRHRRCVQLKQPYTTALGFETPQLIVAAGLKRQYEDAIRDALNKAASLPVPASHYLLPFATRSRFLFRMDFAEADYICRLRSGVKGHFSYRTVAWLMWEKLSRVEPELSRLIQVTPPWVEDPLKR